MDSLHLGMLGRPTRVTTSLVKLCNVLHLHAPANLSQLFRLLHKSGATNYTSSFQVCDSIKMGGTPPQLLPVPTTCA